MTRWKPLLGIGAAAMLAVVVADSACRGGDRPNEGATSDGGTPSISDAHSDRPAPGPQTEGGDGSGLPSLAALVGNDELWSPIPNGGDCSLREGKVVPDPFPSRKWVACGGGCRSSPMAP